MYGPAAERKNAMKNESVLVPQADFEEIAVLITTARQRAV
jgi:hypothetical protein